MTLADRDGVIWMDGEMVPWREAKIHVLTHSLHYGMAVFEGIRAYHTDKGPAVFRLQDHNQRLMRSAHIMDMKVNFTAEEIDKATVDVIKGNNLDSAYVRPIIFYGAENLGIRADNLKTHIAVAAWEWGAYLGEENMQKGIRIRTSSYTRHHVNVAMCKAKATGNYINSMLALGEAVRCGYDEALLLDPQGYVAEGSGENIFVIRNGIIFTPELTSALDGITRGTVIELAQELGYEIREKQMTRDEIYICDEAFFTGTAAEVTPIREYDDRQIGNGGRGPITEKLQSYYFDVVHGRTEKHANWLTHVQ